jgi:hypothetical protein
MLAGDLEVPTLIIEQPLPRTVPLRLMLRQPLKHFVLGGSKFPDGFACVFHKLPESTPFCFRCCCVTPVFRHGPADAFDAFCGFRPGTESAVKATPAVLHGRAPAR